MSQVFETHCNVFLAVFSQYPYLRRILREISASVRKQYYTIQMLQQDYMAMPTTNEIKWLVCNEQPFAAFTLFQSASDTSFVAKYTNVDIHITEVHQALFTETNNYTFEVDCGVAFKCLPEIHSEEHADADNYFVDVLSFSRILKLRENIMGNLLEQYPSTWRVGVVLQEFEKWVDIFSQPIFHSSYLITYLMGNCKVLRIPIPSVLLKRSDVGIKVSSSLSLGYDKFQRDVDDIMNANKRYIATIQHILDDVISQIKGKIK